MKMTTQSRTDNLKPAGSARMGHMNEHLSECEESMKNTSPKYSGH